MTKQVLILSLFFQSSGILLFNFLGPLDMLLAELIGKGLLFSFVFFMATVVSICGVRVYIIDKVVSMKRLIDFFPSFSAELLSYA